MVGSYVRDFLSLTVQVAVKVGTWQSLAYEFEVLRKLQEMAGVSILAHPAYANDSIVTTPVLEWLTLRVISVQGLFDTFCTLVQTLQVQPHYDCTFLASTPRAPFWSVSCKLCMLSVLFDALQDTHSHDLLHRDVKPDNMLYCAGTHVHGWPSHLLLHPPTYSSLATMPRRRRNCSLRYHHFQMMSHGSMNAGRMLLAALTCQCLMMGPERDSAHIYSPTADSPHQHALRVA